LVNIYAVNIEKLLKKIVPDVISILIIPLTVVVSSVVLAFVFFAPIGKLLSS
jgi:phosphotransferase system  glucose/maltose/N-acetylglucosamine-specific IIC component